MLAITNSLVDANSVTGGDGAVTGGGILSRAGRAAAPIPATLIAVNTTVALNQALGLQGTGAGIAIGGTGNETTFQGLTVARNNAQAGQGVGGILIAQQGDVATIGGSLVANNTIGTGGLVNCGGAGTLQEVGTTNREGFTTCPFEVAGLDPGLSPALINAGGDTDVLTIGPASSAKNVVTPCIVGGDQRGALA